MIKMKRKTPFWGFYILSGLCFSWLLYYVSLNPLSLRAPASDTPSSITPSCYVSLADIAEFNARSADSVQASLLTPDKYVTDGLKLIDMSPFGHGPMLRRVPDAKALANLGKEQYQELTYVTFNVQNLRRTEWRLNPDTGIAEEHIVEKPHDTKLKMALATRRIKDGYPDVIFKQELGRPSVVQEYTDDYLEKKYTEMMLGTNDFRVVHIGAMVRKDLPDIFEWHSNALFEGEYMGDQVKLFRRDVGIFVRKHPLTEKVREVFLVVHFKSKRGLRGDPEAILYRTAEAEGVNQLIKLVYKQYGRDVDVAVVGDLNEDFNADGPPMRALKRKSKLTNSLDLRHIDFQGERATHTYHPSRNVTEAHQFDGFLVNRSFANSGRIVDSYIHRYRYRNGREKPIPRSRAERNKNPSDHFPVILRVRNSPE